MFRFISERDFLAKVELKLISVKTILGKGNTLPKNL